MKGVKKVVRVDDSTVAVVADTWWHAKTALDALPIVWDDGENAKVSSESIAEVAGRGPRRFAARLRRQPERRRQGRHRRRRQEGRGGLQLSLPEPRRDGADERHGALHRRTSAKCGPERRTAKRPSPRVLEASGLPAEKCEVHKHDPRRRLRPSRHDRLCAAGRRSSPSRCRARRSSCCGRAKKTCCTAPIIRSPRAN